MTYDEIKRLLGQAAARDARQPSQAMLQAWKVDLDGMTFEEATEGINRHKRDSTDYLEPAHIWAYVRIIRDEKRRGTSAPLQLMRSAPGPDEQAAINQRGAAMCREKAAKAIEAAEQRRYGTDTDPIREAALQRARREKRERLLAPARNPQMPGLVAQATAHLIREDA